MENTSNPFTAPLVQSGVFDKQYISASVQVPPRIIHPLARIFLLKENGAEIKLRFVYDPNAHEAPLSECYAISMKMYRDYDCHMMSEKYQTDGAPGRDPGFAMNRISFELPGGILPESTYADVISVYGAPGKTTLFKESEFDKESVSLYYGVQKTLQISFCISFLTKELAERKIGWGQNKWRYFENKVYTMDVSFNGHCDVFNRN